MTRTERELAALKAEVAKLAASVRSLQAAAPASVALEKFNAGAPMTSEEVAVVLGCSPHAVRNRVYYGTLRRRFDDRAGFHPDDLRACLAGKRTEPPADLKAAGGD